MRSAELKRSLAIGGWHYLSVKRSKMSCGAARIPSFRKTEFVSQGPRDEVYTHSIDPKGRHRVASAQRRRAHLLNLITLRVYTARMKGVYVSVAVFSLLFAIPALARESDAQVRQHIIDKSIASYPGSCPCPYNTDRAGRRCGARSAYSRPGGISPRCYPSDVTEADIAAYRASH